MGAKFKKGSGIMGVKFEKERVKRVSTNSS